MLLQVVGAIWAVIGFANLVGMFATPGVSTGIGTFGLIFNMVLFVIPGLGLFALGYRLSSRGGGESNGSAKRLADLESLKNHGMITDAEYEARRRAILESI
jgi:hypothetical protein